MIAHSCYLICAVTMCLGALNFITGGSLKPAMIGAIGTLIFQPFALSYATDHPPPAAAPVRAHSQGAPIGTPAHGNP
jgi:hypothetical protein